MVFEHWMTLVDDYFRSAFGLQASDFPDWNWRTAYKDGVTPREAFELWADEEGSTAHI